MRKRGGTLTQHEQAYGGQQKTVKATVIRRVN